ncbi:RNA polymerase sigma factor [Flagellimonas lutaonensis]|uniref:RNA polymerase subunit sigma-24 n=1 Tax=Flagellimonas lutaonensis TaxID=516051 RepID=A0A0D5YUA0_9FLAO|nr:sigma-70 family RNA polymerase sigma factor [Allomuricauda lutaonensis]AKA35907.1 RNA polymerase subunit sigma-24 [Allomuricauda lutaonensis]
MSKLPTDNDLMTRLANGDKQALYIIYDRYAPALYGVILRMCRNRVQAEDLLQESFVKIWQNAHRYDRTKGRFYTWAYRIAKNIGLNALRKPMPLIQNEDLSVHSNKEDATTIDYTGLNGALKKLEPHHQKAIELVYFRGYTHREAHEEMDVPLGTFKSYVRQALKLLRESYGTELMITWSILQILA